MSQPKTQEAVESEVGHIMPYHVLALVWGSLLILTIATVVAARFDHGQWNLWIALMIALVKASLVALYFMHLRYDRPLYAIIFITALVFVVLFVGLSMLDAIEYQPDLIPGYQPGMGG